MLLRVVLFATFEIYSICGRGDEKKMARKFALRKLIELRISRGLSQRGLAKLIDASSVTVSRWERVATSLRGTQDRKHQELTR